jgi:hypothetical protein
MQFIGYVDLNTKELSKEYSKFCVFWEDAFNYLIDIEAEHIFHGPPYISVKKILKYHYLLEGVGEK